MQITEKTHSDNTSEKQKQIQSRHSVTISKNPTLNLFKDS